MKPTMLERLLLPEIRELLDTKDFETLRDVLVDWEPADLASLVSDLEPDQRTWVFRSLEAKTASAAFEYLDFDIQEELIESLPGHELAKILDGLAPDDRTALLEVLPTSRKQRLLALLSPEERKVAETLLSYPEDSVGRLMTPDYIAVKERWTIEQTLDYLRAYGKDSETLNAIYVTDEQGKLLDDIRIRYILLAPPRATLSSLMDGNFVALRVDQPQNEAVEQFRRYDRTALPVVNAEEVLVGIVTVDDVLDVAEEQATREMQLMAAVEALEEPYDATPLLVMVRKRASWLVILFLGEMLTATAMGFFEDEIQRAVVLALFVPLIISSGGNSGSQAATLIVRSLALGEVTLKQWSRVFGRELLSGLLLGLILGVGGFLRVAAGNAVSGTYGPHWALIGVTVATTLVCVVMLGTLAGSMLPFLMKRLGFDPASSSAPFVATVVDVTGLLIYFGVATLLLTGTLL